MIRYALVCAEDHAFEAWFPDSDSFDRQSAAGHVSCPVCGSADVRKAVMAPAGRRSAAPRRGTPAFGPAPAPAADSTTAPALIDDRFARMRAALRDIHAKLKRDATDVGPAFPEQARAIHEGVEPPRAIYGTATDAEVRGLVEDGIGVMAIPALPDERN